MPGFVAKFGTLVRETRCVLHPGAKMCRTSDGCVDYWYTEGTYTEFQMPKEENMTTQEGHIHNARMEKAKSLAKALHAGLVNETTPLEAATMARDVTTHHLWWATVSHTADTREPSQQTVDLVIDLLEFVEEIKDIERGRVDGSRIPGV